jgi:muscleblind protein
MIQSWLAWNLFQNHWSKAFSFFADHVEITDMRVTVCRDAVSGKCLRNSCKFYHLPIVLPHPATLASSMTRWNQLPHSTHKHTHTHTTHPLSKTTIFFFFLNSKQQNDVRRDSSVISPKSPKLLTHTHFAYKTRNRFILSIYHFFPVDDLWISFSLSLSAIFPYYYYYYTHRVKFDSFFGLVWLKIIVSSN